MVPAFRKVRVRETVSPGLMGRSMELRVTSTTGWGTLSLAREGITTLSDAVT